MNSSCEIVGLNSLIQHRKQKGRGCKCMFTVYYVIHLTAFIYFLHQCLKSVLEILRSLYPSQTVHQGGPRCQVGKHQNNCDPSGLSATK